MHERTMQYDVPHIHALPTALLERSLDATAPRSRVECCRSSPSHSTPFPARPAPSRGPEFAPGKLLGTWRLACASVYSSRTVHETQGLAAGAFLQRALSSVKEDARTHGVAGRSFPSEPVRTCGSDFGSFGDICHSCWSEIAWAALVGLPPFCLGLTCSRGLHECGCVGRS